MTDITKPLTEMKAELLTARQLDRWLSGDIPRRILMLPFGGPVPSELSKAGVDIDGEWFDAETDIYGPYAGLRATRERFVDWHHDGHGVPSNAQWMKGAIIGKVVIDADPSEFATDDDVYEGIAADWWAKAGERRLALVKELQRRGQPIFGSTQAAFAQKASTGHIEVWPVIRHTISTSPQNTFAVVPPLKAWLSADIPFDDVGLPALQAALLGLADTLQSDLAVPSAPLAQRELSAKAGRVLSAANEAALQRAMQELSGVLAKLQREDPELFEAIAG